MAASKIKYRHGFFLNGKYYSYRDLCSRKNKDFFMLSIFIDKAIKALYFVGFIRFLYANFKVGCQMNVFVKIDSSYLIS